MYGAGKISKTFWGRVSKEEALVPPDTTEMRRQYERQSVRTFYVGNATTPAELTDVANVLRTVFEMTIVAVAPRPYNIPPQTPRTPHDRPLPNTSTPQNSPPANALCSSS